jgi:hypothetical protein
MDPAGASSGGGKPENQLTGTMFTVNGYRSDAMTVPAAYARLPIWAHTSVAALQPGQVTTFPAGTLGYEWDSDTLNPTRPSGEIDMSQTTVPITNNTLLLDYGNVYGNGTATHSLVMYRDPTSGALVFGTATVQWSWGLETTHANDQLNDNPPIVHDMEQATVNIFAEMGAQPGTLQSDLVAAAVNPDTTGPSVSVTAPTSGSSVPVLSPLTVSGTATDSTGGVVARVEVSSDGGQTWQPATWGSDAAQVSWTYTWTPTTQGPVTLKVRAENGNAYVGPVQNVPVTVGSQQCPCSVFPSTSAPTKVDSGDSNSVNLGMKFTTSQPGYITGVRFYKAAANTGTHVGSLWTATGQLLASATFANETASGWQQVNFSNPVPVKANATYVVSYLAPAGHYSADAQYFASAGAGQAPITATQSSVSAPNGLYLYGSGNAFPTKSISATNYWVDAVMTTGAASSTPPAVTTQSPAPGQTAVPISSPVVAIFTEPIDSSTLSFTLADSSGNPVPASVTWNNSTNTATLTPNSTLGLASTYTATVNASDVFGNAMTSPSTWSFTTATTLPTPQCPCSLWPTSTTPNTVTTTDKQSVELGTAFQTSVAGQVTGVKFYKGPNDPSNAHVGSLWTSTGQQLATGTFTNETSSGWQTLTFANPVSIQANTTYVVSVHFPNGQYPDDVNYFTSPHAYYPLTATGPNNGLYTYGASSVFPTKSSKSSNYYVDVIFTTGAGGSENASVGPSEPGQ